jgi:hypothetical protein
MALSSAWIGAEKSRPVKSIGKWSSVLEGSMAASKASSLEFNLDSSGLDSVSKDESITGDSGVHVRLRVGSDVSSFESLREHIFLPVFFVVTY